MKQIVNTILQGDCVALIKQLPSESVDLIFADPPYNLQLNKELYRPNETKVDGVSDEWDKFGSFKEYDEFTTSWLTECKRVLKASGALWVIGSYHNIYRVGAILQTLGYWILNDIVWIKSNPMPNFKGTRFTNAHETLLWVAKQQHAKVTFNYKTMKSFNEDVQMRSDWVMPICSGRERLKDSEGKKIHSTQKPEQLIKRILLATTHEGDIILDPFFGSGTTGAVAKLLRRHFIGLEKETRYIKAATARIDAVHPLNELLTAQYQETPKPRVPFGNLVQDDYIKVGTILYSKDKKHYATVMADGTVKNGTYFGSIHKVSAALLDKQSNNGWVFWNIERDGELISIDTLRTLYVQQSSVS